MSGVPQTGPCTLIIFSSTCPQNNSKFQIYPPGPSGYFLFKTELLQKRLAIREVLHQFPGIFRVITVFLLDQVILTLLYQNPFSFKLSFLFYFKVESFLQKYIRVSQLQKRDIKYQVYFGVRWELQFIVDQSLDLLN